MGEVLTEDNRGYRPADLDGKSDAKATEKLTGAFLLRRPDRRGGVERGPPALRA